MKKKEYVIHVILGLNSCQKSTTKSSRDLFIYLDDLVRIFSQMPGYSLLRVMLPTQQQVVLLVE